MREEYMIDRGGRRFVLYAGLLEEAHARGLRSIETELLQVPKAENGEVAIARAVVRTEDGKFSGIGDASPENVGRSIVPHIIRMAETRAKARALRDAVNVGAVALEELSDTDDAPPVDYPPPRALRDASQRPSADDRTTTSPSADSTSNGRAGTDSPEAAQEGDSQSTNRRGGRGSSQKARKSQVDLLKTLAEELRGENGVARLESRIGKPLSELSRAEADEWIDRLTPAEGRE